MWYLAWLLLMALCGWIAGQIAGGKGRGNVTNFLLGITGALAVRFCFDVLRVSVPDTSALVFSVCGAAALPAFARFFMRRRDSQVAAVGFQTSPVVKGRVIPMPRVTTPPDGHTGDREKMAEWRRSRTKETLKRLQKVERVTAVTHFVAVVLTSLPVSGVSIMERPSLAASVCKLAMAGERAGFTVEQMIKLLKTGITVETLLDIIEARLSEAAPEARSSRWIM